MSGFVKSFALDTVTHNLTDEGRIYIRNALANLSSYPIHGRYRDKLLAWAIKNNHLSLCRLYARRKLKNGKHHKNSPNHISDEHRHCPLQYALGR